MSAFRNIPPIAGLVRETVGDDTGLVPVERSGLLRVVSGEKTEGRGSDQHDADDEFDAGLHVSRSFAKGVDEDEILAHRLTWPA